MTVAEAYVFFENIPKNKSRLKTLYDVGLGYINSARVPQPLSGGEARE